MLFKFVEEDLEFALSGENIRIIRLKSVCVFCGGRIVKSTLSLVNVAAKLVQRGNIQPSSSFNNIHFLLQLLFVEHGYLVGSVLADG